MILLKQLLSSILSEAMTYTQLLSQTDGMRRNKGGRMRVRSLAGSANEDSEQWNFGYKSASDHNTTNGSHEGRISFDKDMYNRNKGKRSMNEVECKVDCSCPDYMYRWAYANYYRDAGSLGKDSLNQCNGSVPGKTNPRLKPSLCKHLVALSGYLKTKLDESFYDDMGEKLSDVVNKNKQFEIKYEE